MIRLCHFLFLMLEQQLREKMGPSDLFLSNQYKYLANRPGFCKLERLKLQEIGKKLFLTGILRKITKRWYLFQMLEIDENQVYIIIKLVCSINTFFFNFFHGLIK